MNSNNRKSITINDLLYTISSTLVDKEWKIVLTNLDDLFIEKLTRQEIVERCEKLNPLLSIEDIDVDTIIHELFDNIPQYAVGTLSETEIKLQTVIEGGTFKFVIHFNRANDQEFREEVMRPITSYVVELQRKFYDLIDEIKRKDVEILEYKANGAELIRKHIETKPFNVKSWVSDAFEDYRGLISICQSVSHNQKFESEKDIKVESDNSNTMMDERKVHIKCKPKEARELELEKGDNVKLSNDSVKYKRRKTSGINS